MEVSVQLEALAFFTARTENWYPLKWRLGGPPEPDWTFWRRVHLFRIGVRNLAHTCSMVATPATLLQPISYHLMLNNSKPHEGSLNRLVNTAVVRKVSGHFKYLENRSRGLDVTWQPVRRDLTAHL